MPDALPGMISTDSLFLLRLPRLKRIPRGHAGHGSKNTLIDADTSTYITHDVHVQVAPLLSISLLYIWKSVLLYS
jgi:hypothetical protein